MNKKIIGVAIGAAIAIAILLLILMPMIQPHTSMQNYSHNTKLGLVVFPPSQRPNLKEVQDAYIKAAGTGIGRSNIYLSWPNIEPTQGNYNWSTSDILMELNREQQLNVTLYFSVINNQLFGPFPNWLGQPQFDKKFQDETIATLDSVLSRYYIVDYVIIGGNIDSYFRDNPNEIPKYVDYFNGVYSKLKEKHPNVKFGNWFSLNDVANHYEGDMIGKLNQGDFVAYSFAPVDLLYFHSQNPQQQSINLQKMIDYAKGKKIALMEVGWSTDASINGTKEKQDDFMKIVFDFYRKNQSDFEFLTWYREYDRPFNTCYNSLNQNTTMFTAEHVLNNTAAYLCGTGLIDVNGNPKPAWDEFIKQIDLSHNS